MNMRKGRLAMAGKRVPLIHINTPHWMIAAVKDHGNKSDRTDAEIFRAALTTYLNRLGYTEEKWLDENFLTNNTEESK
ncbi:hypothetical protein ACIREO_02870 [Streptomyces sp. NPDC102441]|uniref:hypothetical protein n=1 Tax=Streptomyces sp. NPDC102441 TaxID=3366176 RepID=UPI00381014F0